MYKWRQRLKQAPRDVDVFRQVLAVHTLIAEPTEDLESWLQLVKLARKEQMFSLCKSLLLRLGAPMELAVQEEELKKRGALIDFDDETASAGISNQSSTANLVDQQTVRPMKTTTCLPKCLLARSLHLDLMMERPVTVHWMQRETTRREPQPIVASI